ncbi:hypothetical protein C8J57DRAFT_1503078 [Mycena rebaudengoi]|nr:hypothetical protein C8J57DRAFT_1503078 [Mycena rebaudengoi]
MMSTRALGLGSSLRKTLFSYSGYYHLQISICLLNSPPPAARSTLIRSTFAKRIRLLRPPSPHFTTYQPQLAWMASIANRATGGAPRAWFAACAIVPLPPPLFFIHSTPFIPFPSSFFSPHLFRFLHRARRPLQLRGARHSVHSLSSPPPPPPHSSTPSTASPASGFMPPCHSSRSLPLRPRLDPLPSSHPSHPLPSPSALFLGYRVDRVVGFAASRLVPSHLSTHSLPRLPPRLSPSTPLLRRPRRLSLPPLPLPSPISPTPFLPRLGRPSGPLRPLPRSLPPSPDVPLPPSPPRSFHHRSVTFFSVGGLRATRTPFASTSLQGGHLLKLRRPVRGWALTWQLALFSGVYWPAF